MDCRILRQIMLKSEGHLVCDDSVGYGINLGHVSLEPGWRIKDVLNSPKYRHVRHSFAEDRIPWPGMCEGCNLFSAGATANDTLDHRVELLVEPTLSCDISCACCFRKQIISKGRSTGSLDPAILLQLVKGCNAENINIEQVHYIGWGEPLMHDRFEELPNIVKRTFPLASQTVTTAANVEFRRSMGSAPLDSIVVSADSSRQSAYERYRRGGHMQTVFKFMADCKRHGHNGIFPEWKYILFEWNDSNEDVLEAQRIGDDLGVDSLLFIITSSKWAS